MAGLVLHQRPLDGAADGALCVWSETGPSAPLVIAADTPWAIALCRPPSGFVGPAPPGSGILHIGIVDPHGHVFSFDEHGCRREDGHGWRDCLTFPLPLHEIAGDRAAAVESWLAALSAHWDATAVYSAGSNSCYEFVLEVLNQLAVCGCTSWTRALLSRLMQPDVVHAERVGMMLDALRGGEQKELLHSATTAYSCTWTLPGCAPRVVEASHCVICSTDERDPRSRSREEIASLVSDLLQAEMPGLVAVNSGQTNWEWADGANDDDDGWR
eukprot:m.44330 g.44330  ORF g.44330 m.44330 type:complete len:271 (+) comp6191_c0_seq1:67-879(+)